jgi:hypothetical protein
MWPWQSSGHRIKDLKAPDLAEAATIVLQKLGRNALSGRLIYRALELDAHQPQALLMLSEFYRGKSKAQRPTGDEIFSGIVIEYAVDAKSPLSVEQRRLFDKARIEVMKLWGFVTPRGAEFDIDYLGYMTYINELTGQVGSVLKGYQTALTKLGAYAGIFDLAKGRLTPTYGKWLHCDAATLAHPALV